MALDRGYRFYFSTKEGVRFERLYFFFKMCFNSILGDNCSNSEFTISVVALYL